jgi:hypothetical protein
MSTQSRTRGTHVRDWYTAPRARDFATRSEVWGLLRWYHHTWVVPHRGLRGFLRRIWARLTGNRGFLMSPWEQLELRLALLAHQQAAQERVRANGDGRDEDAPRIEVVPG